MSTTTKKKSARQGHGACYCEACDSVWEYEPRDFFVGELYCPVCATRQIDRKARYADLDAARGAHPEAKIYED